MLYLFILPVDFLASLFLTFMLIIDIVKPNFLSVWPVKVLLFQSDFPVISEMRVFSYLLAVLLSVTCLL